MLAKNDAAQLLFLEVKLYMCDLVLKIYISSMKKWAWNPSQDLLESVSQLLSVLANISCSGHARRCKSLIIFS